MTDHQTNSASATGDVPAAVQVDVQDPLPETDWMWRRTYTFTISLLSLAFIWGGIESLHELKSSEQIYYITRYMIGILAMLILFYMVAPSAEQIVKLVQAAKLLRSGVTMNRTASVETPEGRTEVKTQAGTPVDHGRPPMQGGSGQRPRRPRSPYVDEE